MLDCVLFTDCKMNSQILSYKYQLFYVCGLQDAAA